MHGITQRSNVQEGSISNSRTSPPNSGPKIVGVTSRKIVEQSCPPCVADTNPTLASCSFVRVYRGRESSLTSPGATSFLHDLDVHTHTLYARARLAISKRNSRLPCLSLSAALSNRVADKAGPWLMDEWWRKKRVDKIIAAISSTKMRQWSLDGRKLLLYTDCDAGIRA